MQTDLSGLLEWRCVGPFRGGRVVAVAGDPRRPATFYFGAVAGGVWKTADAGQYWENVSDGFFATASVGALAVAPSDGDVIYAGTGETTIRIDVSYGDGVYKSEDAGRSWRNVGLRETRQIAKIRVHPTDPQTLWVAALGHAFGPNSERGIFKSTDGGASWRHTLAVSDRAGAVDLTLDANPRIMYAAVWEAERGFWQISSGGQQSGIWRSDDGGETWHDLSKNHGLPAGPLGKIGLAASPSQPGRIYAIVEHTTLGGLYRSDDYGATWDRTCDNQKIVSRAWYYQHLTADPQDADTVYINNLSLWRSGDGGKTVAELATPHGDNHDLWIDPNDTQRMIQGNDGGACVSLNGGASWSSIYNQPTAQFYHVAADSRDPYYIYGTQQDNTSIAVPSRSPRQSIGWHDCFIAGTGESGYIQVHPDNPDIVYVGAIGSSPGGGDALQRYDHKTGQIRLIGVWPEINSGLGAGEHKYRFAWTYPIVISRHDPSTIYVAGNIVFKTTNEGQSWQPISPDLSRAEPSTLLPTGGPVNRDAIGAETYATVFALVESPHEVGVLWAGSDDGLLHISRDGGASWQNITPPQLPPFTLVSCIELSAHTPGTVYIAATRYKHDEYRPIVLRTTDDGATWSEITGGIAGDAFTRVVREDPSRAGLLYLGTEKGLYLSLDAGNSWQPFQLNLPVCPIHDLLVHRGDLIAATHGRAFWVLDDLTPLHQLAEDTDGGDAHLFVPRPAVRILPGIDWGASLPGKNYVNAVGGAFSIGKAADGSTVKRYLDHGSNPPSGAALRYWLKETPASPITLSISAPSGSVLRAVRSADAGAKPADVVKALPAKAGWNTYIWDLRGESAPKIVGKDPPSELTIDGPFVPPGTYRVALSVGIWSHTEDLLVVKPAAVTTSDEDLHAQAAFLAAVHATIVGTIESVNTMRRVRGQLVALAERLEAGGEGRAELAAEARAVAARALDIEKTILIPDLRSGWGDSINAGVRLFERLLGVPEVATLGDYPPTDAIRALYDELKGKIAAQTAAFDALLSGEIAALNARLASGGVPLIG